MSTTSHSNHQGVEPVAPRGLQTVDEWQAWREAQLVPVPASPDDFFDCQIQDFTTSDAIYDPRDVDLDAPPSLFEEYDMDVPSSDQGAQHIILVHTRFSSGRRQTVERCLHDSLCIGKTYMKVAGLAEDDFTKLAASINFKGGPDTTRVDGTFLGQIDYCMDRYRPAKFTVVIRGWEGLFMTSEPYQVIRNHFTTLTSEPELVIQEYVGGRGSALFSDTAMRAPGFPVTHFQPLYIFDIIRALDQPEVAISPVLKVLIDTLRIRTTARLDERDVSLGRRKLKMMVSFKGRNGNPRDMGKTRRLLGRRPWQSKPESAQRGEDNAKATSTRKAAAFSTRAVAPNEVAAMLMLMLAS